MIALNLMEIFIHKIQASVKLIKWFLIATTIIKMYPLVLAIVLQYMYLCFVILQSVCVLCLIFISECHFLHIPITLTVKRKTFLRIDKVSICSILELKK